MVGLFESRRLQKSRSNISLYKLTLPQYAIGCWSISGCKKYLFTCVLSLFLIIIIIIIYIYIIMMIIFI